MNDIQSKCIKLYKEHKNLKVVASHANIPWQKVYVHLKKAGIAVTGDKLRYGSETDKLARKGELYFLSKVPFAIDQNNIQFQSKFDFEVNGFSVDVKSSTQRKSNKNNNPDRWAFSSKKQESEADFFVLLGYCDGGFKYCWLIPGEIARHYQTISISCVSRKKWWEYEIDADDLADFFNDLKGVA